MTLHFFQCDNFVRLTICNLNGNSIDIFEKHVPMSVKDATLAKLTNRTVGHHLRILLEQIDRDSIWITTIRYKPITTWLFKI